MISYLRCSLMRAVNSNILISTGMKMKIKSIIKSKMRKLRKISLLGLLPKREL